ncbi:MAG TPA: hypothetical protein VHO24_03255 [Opitutaceae bacterium]|nr:hypothetical protein [Opitutaceae bacterium]
MSHDPSRKQFFGRLLGLIAAAGLAPKLLAKSPETAASAPAPAVPAIQIRPALRTVARRSDAL